MRELFVSSYGNELSIGFTLALWLFWTAAGSSLFGRVLQRFSAPRLLAGLQIAAALALFVSILLIRSSRAWWNAMPGEVLGPVPILGTSLIALAAFCPVSGWLFAAGARAYTEESCGTISQGGSSTYLMEAAGSAFGGILASVIFVRYLDSWQIAIVVAAVNFALASCLTFRQRPTRYAVIIFVSAAALVSLLSSERLELLTASKAWPGFRVLATSNSRYGSLAAIATEGNRSIVQNGLVLFTVPDPPTAEEAVHFPLLEHPAPRSVLLIGGGLNGSMAEVLRHPGIERVDYVELDPEVLRLARASFPEDWARSLADRRVRTHHVDGRLFLKSTKQRYDVIILNLPDPQTAQLNRFYTQEFFREIRTRLGPEGVLGFQLHAAEEYISPELAEFLACIRTTLRQVFPEVIAIPGENVHFLASVRHGVLTNDPQVLLRRLAERRIETLYMREYYLPFRMTPERIADLDTQLSAAPATRLNRDFSPIAYYFNVALWGAQFSPKYRDAFLSAAAVPFRTVVFCVGMIVLLLTIIVGRARRPDSARRTAGFAVALAGLTLMAAEILLLLGFQAIYGYVFDELAALVAGYMAGMALGSWYAKRQVQQEPASPSPNHAQRLLLVQLAVTLLPIALVAALFAVSRLQGFSLSLIAHAGFPVVAAICGLLGGYQFPIAMELFSAGGTRKNNAAGKLYGLDLLGASIGAVAISAYVLPVFGFMRGAELVALANVGPVLLLALLLRRFSAAFARS